MTGYTLAVFSDSPDYIHRFLAYCRDHDAFFDISGFTDLQALKDFLTGCSIDILLLPRYLYQTETINKSDNVKEIVCLGEQQDLNSSPKEINMYQPMGNILDDLKSIASSLDADRPRPSANLSVFGMFVLEGDASAGDLALLLAESPEHSAENILYIDLDPFSGFAAQHSLSPSGTLSDLIFQFVMGPVDLAGSIRKCAVRIGSLHYVAPPAAGEDPDEVPYLLWNSFLTDLASAGNYSEIFVNLSSHCRNFLHMFENCRKIYLFSFSYGTAVSGDPGAGYSGFRAMAFHEYFSRHERPDILRKMENAFQITADLEHSVRNSSGRSRKVKDKWKKTT